MKRLILVSAILAATTCLAQNECSRNNPLFKSDNYAPAKEVYSLGSNPEFPFLRNLSTPKQVASAIKAGTGKHGMTNLNSMLMDIGFTNGAKDVNASSVTAYNIPSGTVGNMGDGNFNTAYIKLMGDGDGVKAWKISSSTGCYVYILAKCGNAFYPAKPAKATTSLDVPLNLNSASKELTLDCAEPKITTRNTYVYYHKNKHRDHALAPAYSDLDDPRASTPVLLNTTKKVEAVPQTYKITVSTPDNNVKVYDDRPLDVAADINVEKISEYTGYYPSYAKKQYKEVSKRVYRKSERKMRKAIHKEEKVARLTGIGVNTEVVAKK